MKKYLIGWSGIGQCIYGKNDSVGNYNYVDTMTLKQAKKLRSGFPKANGRQKVLIFKLVSIK